MKELNFDLNLEVKRLSEQWPEKSESIEKVLNSLEPRIEKKLFLQFLESFDANNLHPNDKIPPCFRANMAFELKL